MKKYVFITNQGFTFQPHSKEAEPDIENCQVIGFSDGANPKKAFSALIRDNSYLLNTSFNKLICYELKNSRRDYFYMNEYSRN